MERVAIIGYGAMGRLLAERLADKVSAVIVRPETLERVRAQLPKRIQAVSSVADALASKPTLFIECAGHAGLRAHGAAALETGTDLLVASVGALADAALEQALRKAAEASKAAVLVPAGALGGLDVLGAARYAGIDEVTYTSVKAVQAWRGTHAQTLLDLDQVRSAAVFFTGTAREAARLFPQNANVAAAVALAGIGFDRTKVSLTADPAARGNKHRIQASGPFGSIDVVVEGRPLPSNPKTSMLAPMSLIRAVESRSAALRII